MNTTDPADVLPEAVAGYIAAANAFAIDAIMATFSQDALVNESAANSSAPRRSTRGRAGNWSTPRSPWT
ncbi:hypothetical protein AB0O86_32040 [Streptomyces hirsutus]|uniref:hypothetical protein n=1 Tax=Streptomyces hirsutus TaxID=35620 RepID=UPI003427A50D